MNITQVENTLTLNSVQTSGYKYLHVIQRLESSISTILLENITDSISTLALPSDGYYLIVEFSFPTTPGNYYYTTGGVIYDPNDVEVSTENLLDLNATAEGIDRNDTEFFTVYLLETYYISMLKDKFLKGICSCGCISASDKITIDALTMGLYLIEKLNVYFQYYESQRIVEQLLSCTNLVTASCNCND